MKAGTIQFTEQEARHMHQSSVSMGSAALALGILVCVALVGYRMVFGNDHGHAQCSAHTVGSSSSLRKQEVLDRRRWVLDSRRGLVKMDVLLQSRKDAACHAGGDSV